MRRQPQISRGVSLTNPAGGGFKPVFVADETPVDALSEAFSLGLGGRRTDRVQLAMCRARVRGFFCRLVLPLLVQLVLLGSLGSPVIAQQSGGFQEVPVLQSLVVDTTGVLGSDAAALAQRLEGLKRETGAEVAVLILRTTAPETIEQYSIRVVEQWGLGRRGINDGALLIVALQDRAVRIEVGRGLEGDIPDLRAHRIIDEQILPLFRAGHVAAGIQAGAESLERLVRGMDLPAPVPEHEDASRFQAILPIFLLTYTIGAFLSVVFGRAFGALVGSGVGLLLGVLFLPAMVAGAVVFFSVLFVLAGGHSGGRWASPSGRVGHGYGGSMWSGGGWSGSGGSFGGGGTFSGGGASGRW